MDIVTIRLWLSKAPTKQLRAAKRISGSFIEVLRTAYLSRLRHNKQLTNINECHQYIINILDKYSENIGNRRKLRHILKHYSCMRRMQGLRLNSIIAEGQRIARHTVRTIG